jgi:CheY-like chemotaxis protein
MILFVDDDSDTREMYFAALSFLGCSVITAPGASQALDHARWRHPDVIVTDLVFPDGDGWGLIRSFKDDPRISTIPIIVLTGHSTPADPARARSAGCAAYLLKPCLPEELLATVRRVLQFNGAQHSTH